MVTETPSSEVGAMAPMKSVPAHCRVLWARLAPLISSQDPGAKVLDPPKSPSELTEATTALQPGGGATGSVTVAVNVAVRAPAVAVTVRAPALVGVTPMPACPVPSVAVVEADRVAVPAVTWNLTANPGTGKEARPVTLTIRALSVVPVTPDCALPLTMSILTGSLGWSLRMRL